MRKPKVKPEDLPAAVLILGRTIPVTIKPRLRDSTGRLEGTFQPTEGRIQIAGDLTPEQARSCLFHETLHAAIYYSGQSLYIDTIPNLEESLVLAFESAFAHAIDIDKLKANQ